MKKRILFIIIAALLIFSWGCSIEDETLIGSNSLKINFQFKESGQDVVFSEMCYTNAAGNQYEVTEIMYFISDLRLYRNGAVVNPAQWNDIHYIDSNLHETLEWIVGSNIPAGEYDSLTFTFGLSEKLNKSFLFVNPPEVGMSWPEVLGGGYHYMMFNGFWKDTADIRKPFDFHLGIGQIYKNNTGQVADITGFIHNNFSIKPSGPSIMIKAGEVSTINLVMNIQSWFESPLIFDFNVWGGSIMQKQDAMHIGCLNGKDVFSFF